MPSSGGRGEEGKHDKTALPVFWKPGRTGGHSAPTGISTHRHPAQQKCPDSHGGMRDHLLCSGKPVPGLQFFVIGRLREGWGEARTWVIRYLALAFLLCLGLFSSAIDMKTSSTQWPRPVKAAALLRSCHCPGRWPLATRGD